MPLKMALTAVGRDRPGIVAAVSRVLFQHGCNLEDSTMTILEGEFAMILLVAVPGEEWVEALRSDLQQVAEDLHLVLALRDLPEEPPGNPPEPPHPAILSVYGADRPGLVFRVASLLADRAVNITNVTTRVVGEATPVYIMILELSLPRGMDAGDLRGTLEALGRELGVDMTLRPLQLAERL